MSIFQESWYTKDCKRLDSAAANAVSITIHRNATEIYGEKPSLNAFTPCSGTIVSFDFQEDPLLETIQKYAFYGCSRLSAVNLSGCTHLTTIQACAFEGCIAVSRVLFPNSLSSIGDGAFRNGKSLKSVFFPASITSIGTSCFFSSAALESVIYEEGIKLTTITTSCFRYTKLKNITIPRSVTKCSNGCFEAPNKMTFINVQQGNLNYKSINGVLFDISGTSLITFPPYHSTSYVVPEKVSALGFVAFSDSIIQYVTLPSTLTRIEGYCFKKSALKSIKIPDSVTLIREYAFNSCTQLSSIEMPKNISTLSSYLFTSCAFTFFEINEGVESIQDYCFSNCKQLLEVVLPSTITSLGGGVFSGCPNNLIIRFAESSPFMIYNNYTIVNKEKTILYQYLGSLANDKVSIPNTIITIKSGAFSNKKNIKSVIFEDASCLQSINSRAFAYCSFLSEFTLPLSVAYIYESAFEECSSLTSISFGSKIEILEKSAFYNCYRLVTVQFNAISRSLALGVSCFKYCSAITTLTLTEGITAFNDEVFYTTTSLKYLLIPSTLTTINENVFAFSGIEIIDFAENSHLPNLSFCTFYQCTKLKTIHLPDTISSLGPKSFANSNLSSFVVPVCTHTIFESCFENCNFMVSFTIPVNCALNTIKERIFSGCSSLAVLSSSIGTYIIENGAMFNSDRSVLIVFPPASDIKVFCFPQNVKIVNPSAFIGCVNLEIVTIPEKSVEKIFFSAFEGCTKLHTINFPSCVNFIDQNAFLGCKNLRCGLSIDNSSPEFLHNLLENAKIPARSLKECKQNSCMCRCRTQSMKIQPFVFFAILSI